MFLTVHIPYILVEPFKRNNHQKTNGSGIFWIYADSTGKQFFLQIQNTTLCRTIFESCRLIVNKIYMQNKLTKPPKETDGKDFDVGRVLTELEEVLTNPLINDVNNVLMLNYGLHYVSRIPFLTFVEMMDRIVELLNSYKTKFHGNIIWRTTNAINRWKYGEPGSDSKHDACHRFVSEPVSWVFTYIFIHLVLKNANSILDLHYAELDYLC